MLGAQRALVDGEATEEVGDRLLSSLRCRGTAPILGDVQCRHHDAGVAATTEMKLLVALAKTCIGMESRRSPLLIEADTSCTRLAVL